MLHSVTCIRVTRNMYHIVTPSLTQTSPPHNACYTVKHKVTCFCVTFTTSSHFLNTHLHCTALDSSVLHCHIVQCPCHNPLKKKRATKVASDLWSADPTTKGIHIWFNIWNRNCTKPHYSKTSKQTCLESGLQLYVMFSCLLSLSNVTPAQTT